MKAKILYLMAVICIATAGCASEETTMIDIRHDEGKAVMLPIGQESLALVAEQRVHGLFIEVSVLLQFQEYIMHYRFMVRVRGLKEQVEGDAKFL